MSPSQLIKSINACDDGASLKPPTTPIFFRMARPLSVDSIVTSAARSFWIWAAEIFCDAMKGVLGNSRLRAITRPPFFSQVRPAPENVLTTPTSRSEEHTSELQSHV